VHICGLMKRKRAKGDRRSYWLITSIMESSAITAVSSLHFSFKYSTVCLSRLRSFISRAQWSIINAFSASMEVFFFFKCFCTINSEIWWNKHQYWEVRTYRWLISTPAVFHHRSCQIFFSSVFWKQLSSCSRVHHR